MGAEHSQTGPLLRVLCQPVQAPARLEDSPIDCVRVFGEGGSNQMIPLSPLIGQIVQPAAADLALYKSFCPPGHLSYAGVNLVRALVVRLDCGAEVALQNFF